MNSNENLISRIKENERRRSSRSLDLEHIKVPSVVQLRQSRDDVLHVAPTYDTTVDISKLADIAKNIAKIQKRFTYILRRKRVPLLYALADSAKKLTGATVNYPSIEELFHEQLQNVEQLNNHLEGVLNSSTSTLSSIQHRIDDYLQREGNARDVAEKTKRLNVVLEDAYTKLLAEKPRDQACPTRYDRKRISLERRLSEVKTAERVAAECLVVTKKSRDILYGTEVFFKKVMETGEKALNKSRLVQSTFYEVAGAYQKSGDIFQSVSTIGNRFDYVHRYAMDIQKILIEGLHSLNNLNRHIEHEAKKLLTISAAPDLTKMLREDTRQANYLP